MVEPRVTVLMPVFNGAAYLREAINSILAQTFNAFEFIIIDDGSTDRTPAIVASYDDPRIRFIQNKVNLGITATLNKGIQLASCPLIARMDADDISRPERLQLQYDFMMRHPDCAMVSAWAHVIDQEGGHVRMERYRHPMFYYNLTFECWVYHPTVMLRKSALETVGGYAMPYSEDYDLFWRLSTRFRIEHIEVPLLDYRLSPASLNTVTRKREYDEANAANVMRNIRYYLGSHVSISPGALACLRHDFSRVIERRDVSAAMEGLRIARAVALKMMARENPNRDIKAIRKAWKCKRRFMLLSLARSLPLFHALALLCRAKAGITLMCLVRDSVKWHVKTLIKRLTGIDHATQSRYYHALRHS